MKLQDPIQEAKRLARRAAEKRYRIKHYRKVMARRARFRARHRERLRQEAVEYNRARGIGPRIIKLKPPRKERIIADPNVRNLVKAAAGRARKRGMEFDLKSSLLRIPDICPVLGLTLKKTPGRCTPETPSLDRIDSSRGYTLDNVRIISWRANALKNNGTLAEFRAIVRDLENLAGAA